MSMNVRQSQTLKAPCRRQVQSIVDTYRSKENCKGPNQKVRIGPIGCPQRHASTKVVSKTSEENGSAKPGPREKNTGITGPITGAAKMKQLERDFYLDLLSSAATKRDAKVFLSRLKEPAVLNSKATSNYPPASETKVNLGSQVNLGGLFGRTRASDQSPVFSQYESTYSNAPRENVNTHQQHTRDKIHVALVEIMDLTEVPDEVVLGVAETLAQLARLSMIPCVIVDGPPSSRSSHEPGVSKDPARFEDVRRKNETSANRLVAAIESVSDKGGVKLDGFLVSREDGETGENMDHGPKVFTSDQRRILHPLRQGQIPVLTPYAYRSSSQSISRVTASQAALALTEIFAGSKEERTHFDRSGGETKRRDQPSQPQILLDRVITIDDTGGIVSPTSSDGRHVFINLEQEFHVVERQLTESEDNESNQRQMAHLRMMQQALRILPPTSSGLMVTFEDAATHSRVDAEVDANSPASPERRPSPSPSMVGTRRQKNQLIHNLLTDKPAYSSSLPSGRLSRSSTAAEAPVPISTSTFLKRGLPLTILPDPTIRPWTSTAPRIRLDESPIDLARLVHLINDSFNRELDVAHYLDRVNDKLAGVIIAGEYEGGAILTWEPPPGVAPTDRERLVPYLDKFAVLKRSQGAGGVADVVFNAMVRTCFPGGVCWRSRKDNPVNKWYFERSRGTWKIPDTNWTMFWTTPNLGAGGGSGEGNGDTRRLMQDYEGVCRGVVPSWVDKKKAAD